MSERTRCFVLMGFGEKVDHRTRRKLDLDKTYKIIRAAVVDAGLECIRADDIVHSGVIDKPMYEHLLTADVAIADLSTSNENAIYELGVRHALRPRTTIIIAEKEFKFPFDLGHVVIRPYVHLGSGIDFEEAERLKNELIQAITQILAKDEPDSPVYTFLDLDPPVLRELKRQIESGGLLEQSSSRDVRSERASEAVFSTLLDAFNEARKGEDWATARALVKRLREVTAQKGETLSNDPYLVQQHAFVTYMSKQPSHKEALAEAKRILAPLTPENTSDAETLGLWGAIHKRIWDEIRDRDALDESVFAYARGFYIKRDYYTGINYAFMLDERAVTQTSAEEWTTDRVLARRIRRQVLAIVEAAIQALPKDENGRPQDQKESYWLRATRVEALFGLKDPGYDEARQSLFETAPEPWMNGTTERQIKKLEALLATPMPAFVN